jgi:solute:Na+ symporter, SSS family
VADYELGWFRLGFELLPGGLVGVFFAAILAIHLSTISSHLNLGALYFTRDLFQRYVRPDADEKTLVWVGRLATAVLLLGSFFYGMMMQEITRWLIFALWLMMAGIWLPNILQVVWWRFNAWGYLSSWMANLGVAWLVVWVLPGLRGLPASCRTTSSSGSSWPWEPWSFSPSPSSRSPRTWIILSVITFRPGPWGGGGRCIGRR